VGLLGRAVEGAEVVLSLFFEVTGVGAVMGAAADLVDAADEVELPKNDESRPPPGAVVEVAGAAGAFVSARGASSPSSPSSPPSTPSPKPT